ncbi:MAG: hypothetical protein JO345_08385 [Streptosporangiaceae bacterium]|nr:hypothetical protein [Streptosporangiaceae bacterium]
MTAQDIDGDFTVVDTGILNRYFRDYHRMHGQAGINAQQRNLLPLFKFLEEEYGHPHPYTTKLNRYTEVKGKPKTLSREFIDDLLEVPTAGRHATSRTPLTTPSSGSSAPRASAAGSCSAW